MDHETENLFLNSDGVLHLRVPIGIDEDDDDRVLKRLGPIEDACDDVPREFDREYEELLDAWNDQQQGAVGYAAAVDLAWRVAKSC